MAQHYWYDFIERLTNWFRLANTIPHPKRANLIALMLVGAVVLIINLILSVPSGLNGVITFLDTGLLLCLSTVIWLFWRRRNRQELALLFLLLGVSLYLVTMMTYDTLQFPAVEIQNRLLYLLAPWFLWITVLEIGCFYCFHARTALRLASIFSAFLLVGIAIILWRGLPPSVGLLRDGLLLVLANGLGLFFAYGLADAHEQNSQTDFLTGLPNRMHAYQALQFEIERAERYNSTFAVILLDLDHFKKINDGYGHPAGDAVLCDFATFAQEHIRRTDTLARWGGEEFLLIMRQSDLASGRLKADHLRMQIKNRALHNGIRITASFGVTAYYPRDTTDTILDRVDGALYRAKANGRNCVETE
jgi:diguanylate cyclase (GGDEF)-like protein